MSKVAVLPTAKTVSADAILEAAREAHLKRVVIVGWDKDGDFFFSGSESIETTVFLLRSAEHNMMKYLDEED
ncbi:MAG: hypothetical protein AB7U76_24950 [Pirellulales bacterium]